MREHLQSLITTVLVFLPEKYGRLQLAWDTLVAVTGVVGKAHCVVFYFTHQNGACDPHGYVVAAELIALGVFWKTKQKLRTMPSFTDKVSTISYLSNCFVAAIQGQGTNQDTPN